MFTVHIGELSRKAHEVEEKWINQQVNRRRREGRAVCVRVEIHDSDACMTLFSCGCALGGGGRWSPNRKQRAIHDLWLKHGLDKCDFTGGHVIAFLKQLRRLVEP